MSDKSWVTFLTLAKRLVSQIASPGILGVTVGSGHTIRVARGRTRETHKQSSHTTNLARFELFFDTLPPHPCVYSNAYSTLRNPSSDSGVYRS